MHQTRSHALFVLRQVFSVVIALLLAIVMLPTAAIEQAFAAGEESRSESETEDVVEQENDGDDSIDLEQPAEDDASSFDDSLILDEETLEMVSPEEGEYEPPESFRYHNGELIVSEYSTRGIGTNYPHGFVQYDSGYHTRSDALNGIDVSYYQGSANGTSINWSRVKAAGIDFAIIRSSDGFSFADPDLTQNVRGCLNNNIPFGIYHYARATNAAEAIQEADRVLQLIASAGVTTGNITYPIYYDIENTGAPNYWSLGRGVVDQIASAFINRIKSAGYNKVGVYSSTSWYNGGPCDTTYINSLEFRWVAQYNSGGLRYTGFGQNGDALKNNGKGMWQFSSQGYVDGISGYVDINYSYYGGTLTASSSTKIDSIDKDGGSFRVTASNVTFNKSINKAVFAVWCNNEGGQDDIRWYNVSRASDGTYSLDVSIKDHKGYEGEYVADFYVYSRTGQSICPSGGRALATISVNVGRQSHSISSDEFSVFFNATGGNYAKATEVKIAVWTTQNGQDDLRWYSASKNSSQFKASGLEDAAQDDSYNTAALANTWQGTISIHHHREAGQYNMHVYAVVNGKDVCTQATTFNISSYTDPGVTMYRLYNPYTSEHFYTSNAGERDWLCRDQGWMDEGIGWIAASGGTPVYRLYNPVIGDHHYTMNLGERNWLISSNGWKDEGIGWYTDGSIAVHQLYNGGLKRGQHFYTTSKAEYDYNVAKNGWKGENVAWYALRVS